MGEISGQEGSWWKIGKPRWYVFERWTLTCKGAHCHGAESRFTTQNGFFLISNRFFKFSWKFSDCCSRVSSKQCLQLIIFFMTESGLPLSSFWNLSFHERYFWNPLSIVLILTILLPKAKETFCWPFLILLFELVNQSILFNC